MTRRWLAAALGFVLVSCAVLGGRAYVWCAPMGRALAHCCCAPAPTDHAALRTSCCDSRVSPSLPSADAGGMATPPVLPPLAFTLPVPDTTERRWPRARGTGLPPVHAARAGPRLRLHARHSVYRI